MRIAVDASELRDLHYASPTVPQPCDVNDEVEDLADVAADFGRAQLVEISADEELKPG